MSDKTNINGKAYWRSLDELAQTPEFRAFVENEFPNHAAAMIDSPNRRQFLKIMGASFGLAGLAGCRRWPEEKLAPFVHRPQGRDPGTTLQYATSMEIGGSAVGLLVTSYDGRPIKIEGNPLHPSSLGAASAIAQASVLELYDPDRSRSPILREQPATQSKFAAKTWNDFIAFARPHFDAMKKIGGTGLAVLSEAASGPSMADMRSRWAKAFPKARWYEYEPISRDNEQEGTRPAFGKPLRPHLQLDKADVVVCLGADIFGNHPNALRYARDWAERRRSRTELARSASEGSSAGNNTGGQATSGTNRTGAQAASGTMPRLYVAESTYTITGSVADCRLPVTNGKLPNLLESILAALRGGAAKTEQFVAAIIKDLTASRGRGILVAGPEQPTEIHAAVAAINVELGNIGQTITYTDEPNADRPTHVEAIKSLVGDLRSGKVNTLVILGGNPVYDAPADLAFTEALVKADVAIHLSPHENETSRLCHWQLPQAHYLEAWGDARAWDGTIGIVQPLIEPLHSGRSAIELLAIMASDDKTQGYDIVRRTFTSLLPKDKFEATWRKALHDGVLENSASPVSTYLTEFQVKDPTRRVEDSTRRTQARGLLSTALADKPPVAQAVGFEIALIPDRKVYDGRFANNGWLQELPDPLTKMTWDNAALISPADADKLGIKTGDVIAIKVNDRQMEIVADVLPGQAAGSIAVALGYGRTAAGRVGDGVGFNAYALRTTTAMHLANGAEIHKTGKTYELACSQDHHAIDPLGFKERKHRAAELIREVPLPIYRQNPNVVREMGERAEHNQLWESPLKYEGHRWGMAIDLNACIGCGACVVACQAENNIPIVGKREVIVGREMHWIRVDRYFSGEVDDPNPGVAYQPMTCHHCENAPCESVCPVAATVHDTEGINTMVYNRCIGTRYCSNNCPFKVRRFNYFDYHAKGPKAGRLPWVGLPDTQQRQGVEDVRRLGFNPDVTVRMRGVMEKCTFCVQRIQAAKIRALNEKRPVKDGEIVPACAATCPTQAIVFGDLNDPSSRVRKLQEDNRAYSILDQLNLRVRTKYLAKIEND